MTTSALSRRLASVIGAILLAAGLLVSTTSPANASTGGGCSYFKTVGNDVASVNIQSCIAVGGGVLVPGNIGPDGYITFTATNPNLWTSCTLTVQLEDVTDFKAVTYKDFDCVDAARANAYYKHYQANTVWGTGGHQYKTYFTWTGYYNNKYVASGTAFSPVLTW
ncbi:hypothetical protein [Nonomuraea sp. NPDC003201]